jgi:hypothetical protein
MEYGGPRVSALAACRDGVGSPSPQHAISAFMGPKRVVQVVPQERAGQPNVEALRLVHSSMLHSMFLQCFNAWAGVGHWGTGRMCVAAGPRADVRTPLTILVPDMHSSIDTSIALL